MKKFDDRLMAFSWIVMDSKLLMNEIERAMATLGINDKFFKFKILAPLYPSMAQKFTNPN